MVSALRARPVAGDRGASFVVWPYGNGSSTEDGNLDLRSRLKPAAAAVRWSDRNPCP